MNSYLIFGISFAFAAAAQPGPLQAYIISQTLKRGWRATLPVCLAPLFSDGPIVILVLLLLKTVPDSFMAALRLGGGIFLVFLGITTYNSWKNFESEQVLAVESQQQTLLRAVVVNALNPAPYLGWSLVMGPLFLEGWKAAPGNGFALLIGFYLTFILSLAGIIFVFGHASRLGPKVSRSLLGLSSIVLFLFGIYQLGMGAQAILSKV